MTKEINYKVVLLRCLMKAIFSKIGNSLLASHYADPLDIIYKGILEVEKSRQSQFQEHSLLVKQCTVFFISSKEDRQMN